MIDYGFITLMSYFNEWILVVGILSCYHKMMMKEMKKETLLEDTFQAMKTSVSVKIDKETPDCDNSLKSISN